MSFENKLTKIQNLYLDTERQLTEVSYTIPLDNKPTVYSPRFYNILQFTCAQIHSLLKIISRNLQLKVKSDRFDNYHKILNRQRMLESQEALFIPDRTRITPFNKKAKHEWWTGYNETKHQLPEGIKQGTIGNVLNSLAAAYVLNNIAKISTWKHEENTILDGKNWHNVFKTYGTQNFRILLETNTQSPISSKFFYLTTQYWSK